MRAHTLQVAALGIVASLAIGCAGGDGGGEGGTNSVTQSNCRLTASSGWQYEVVQELRPPSLTFCPMVLHADHQAMSGTAIVDVDLNKHGGPAGFVGVARMWAVRMPGLPNSKLDEKDVYFTNFAPYVVNGSQPVRGQFTVNWTAGLVSASGAQEVDSLSVEYPTRQAYDGRITAAANVVQQVVISTLPGSITGDALPSGQAALFRSVTDWDTTGYLFQWVVDGTPVQGSSDARFTHSFGHAGIHTVQVQQTIADGTVLSTSKQVTVPLGVTIYGPGSPQPYTYPEFNAVVTGGDAPYTYSWSVDFVNQGGGQTFDTYYTGTPNTTLEVRVYVTDSQGHTGNAVMFSAVQEDCPVEGCLPNDQSKTPVNSPTMPKATRGTSPSHPTSTKPSRH